MLENRRREVKYVAMPHLPRQEREGREMNGRIKLANRREHGN